MKDELLLHMLAAWRQPQPRAQHTREQPELPIEPGELMSWDRY